MPEQLGDERSDYVCLLERIVDCLEQDVVVNDEKHRDMLNELSRLKEHLIELDAELTEEGQKRDRLVERFKARTRELQSKVQFWRHKYEFRSGMEDDTDETEDNETVGVTEQATEELISAQQSYEHERQRSADLLQMLNERDQEICDLQSALQQLEATKQHDIKIGLAEYKERASLASKEIARLTHELEDAKAEALAVPDLKKKIAELDLEVERAKQSDRAKPADQLIEKALVCNLLVNLFDRTRPVDRKQVAQALCNLLNMSEEDQFRMGLISTESEQDQESAPSFADHWITFLYKAVEEK